MKIESVDIFLLRHSGHSYSDYPFQPVVCRINTDEGICGFGEAGISIGPGENGVAHMLKDLSEMILGKDPLDNEVRTFTIAFTAISAAGASWFTPP